MSQNLYEQRGVSSNKSDVSTAISTLDKGLFPTAFCKILPDVLTGSVKHCLVMHADGPGTKSILAYLAHQQGWPINIWHGIAQDAMVMNLDDMACVGAMGPYLISNTINRHKEKIPAVVLQDIMLGYRKFCNRLQELGFECYLAGGETADIGDAVRTLVMDATVVTRMKRRDVIDCGRIVPGDIIVGFSSTGQANWENEPNSGIGANGLTCARHDVPKKIHAQRFPETFAPETDSSLIYCGKYDLDNYPIQNVKQISTIGNMLLSPTRTYLPLIKKLTDALPISEIHGLIHCTGGGQTKIGKYGGIAAGYYMGFHYIKDNLFPVPPLFDFLKEIQPKMSWRDMYTTYNMGHRLEVVLPAGYLNVCLKVAKECNIEAQQVGYVVSSGVGCNCVTVCSPHGEFIYHS